MLFEVRSKYVEYVEVCAVCAFLLIKTVAEDTATSSNRLTMPDLTATCAAQSSGHEQATHLLGDQPSSGLLNQGTGS